MIRDSAISWTGFTHNFWVGCKKKGTECEKCYMHRDFTERFGLDPNKVARTSQKNWDKLYTAQQEIEEGKRKGNSRYCFTCSYSDFFNPEADAWRPAAYHYMLRTPDIFYLILTKLPNRIKIGFPEFWPDLRRHIGIGVSVGVNQSRWRIDSMMQSKMSDAAMRFISAEPLLEHVDLRRAFRIYQDKIAIVMAGGESDFIDPRPMNPEWADFMRIDCEDAGVLFHFKQMGGAQKIEGVFGGNKLYGNTYLDMPNLDELAPVLTSKQKALIL